MWFEPPFYFSEAISVAAKNLAAAADWYQSIFDLDRQEKPEENEIWLGRLGKGALDPMVAIVGIHSDGDRSRIPKHPIIFTKNIKKAHRWFSERILTTEAIQSDSGGNAFFKFRDIEGNEVEVCEEPG